MTPEQLRRHAEIMSTHRPGENDDEVRLLLAQLWETVEIDGVLLTPEQATRFADGDIADIRANQATTPIPPAVREEGLQASPLAPNQTPLTRVDAPADTPSTVPFITGEGAPISDPVIDPARILAAQQETLRRQLEDRLNPSRRDQRTEQVGEPAFPSLADEAFQKASRELTFPPFTPAPALAPFPDPPQGVAVPPFIGPPEKPTLEQQFGIGNVPPGVGDFRTSSGQPFTRSGPPGNLGTGTASFNSSTFDTGQPASLRTFDPSDPNTFGAEEGASLRPALPQTFIPEEAQDVFDNESFGPTFARDSNRFAGGRPLPDQPETDRSAFDDFGFAFNTVLGQSGQPENVTDSLRRNTGDFLNRFQAELGNQIDTQGKNTLNPLKFLRGLDLNQEFARLSPRQRDPNSGRLNRASSFKF